MSSGRPKVNTACVRIVGLVLVMASVVSACGGDIVDAGSTPGYSGKEHHGKADFELVEPAETNASTTIAGPAPTLPLPADVANRVRPSIPGGQNDGYVPTPMPKRTTTTTTTTTTTIPVPSTTTTLPPMRPSPINDLTSICGMNQYFQSLVSVFVNPEVDGKATAAQVKQVLRAYVRITPPELQGDMKKVRAMADDLIARLKRAEYNVDDPSLKFMTTLLFTQSPFLFDFFQSYNRLLRYEFTTCGSI